MSKALGESVDRFSPRRFRALDGWRGVCACIVALFHIRSTGAIPHIGIIRDGFLFVDFFFVLSGFVIFAGYGERLASGFPVGRFMLLRLGRTYPLHLFMLGLFFLVELAGLVFGQGGLSMRAAFSEPRSMFQLLTSLTMLQIFGLHPATIWNTPSWSIAAELWTYLLVALTLHWLGSRRFPLVASLATGAALLLLYLAGSNAWNTALPTTLLRCIYGFALGTIGWTIHRRWSSRVPLGFALASVLEVAIVALAFRVVAQAHFSWLALTCQPIFLVAVLIFARERGALSRLICLPPFQLLGTLSYSIYMAHAFVLARFTDLAMLAGKRSGHPLATFGNWDGRTLKLLTGPGMVPDLLAIVALLCVIAFAALTWRFIEQPCRRWSQARAARLGAGKAEAIAPAL